MKDNTNNIFAGAEYGSQFLKADGKTVALFTRFDYMTDDDGNKVKEFVWCFDKDGGESPYDLDGKCLDENSYKVFEDRRWDIISKYRKPWSTKHMQKLAENYVNDRVTEFYEGWVPENYDDFEEQLDWVDLINAYQAGYGTAKNE